MHYQKHHQAYVNGANAVLEKLDKARKDNTDLDMKAILKELSFHIGGYRLHNRFWENLAPAGKGGGGAPKGDLAKAIGAEYGTFDRFKKEFSQTASSVEGSGWAVLTYCEKTQRPLTLQLEKHNMNIIPGFPILMVLDVWEHAYYLDYKKENDDTCFRIEALNAHVLPPASFSALWDISQNGSRVGWVVRDPPPSFYCLPRMPTSQDRTLLAVPICVKDQARPPKSSCVTRGERSAVSNGSSLRNCHSLPSPFPD